MITHHYLIIMSTKQEFVLSTWITHKYFEVFSQWIKEIERELNQIQEKHGITPELVRKIIDDAKKLNK